MPLSLIDTSVLFAAAYERDANHPAGNQIVHGIDRQCLPETVVLDFVLAETLNGLSTKAGHAAAVSFLNRIEANARFSVDSLGPGELTSVKNRFRRHEQLSFVDAAIATYARSNGIEYLYAFDDDFDSIGWLARLNRSVNPYDPN